MKITITKKMKFNNNNNNNNNNKKDKKPQRNKPNIKELFCMNI